MFRAQVGLQIIRLTYHGDRFRASLWAFLGCYWRPLVALAPLGAPKVPTDDWFVELGGGLAIQGRLQTDQNGFEDRRNLFNGPSGGPPDPSWCRPPVLWGAWGRFGSIWGQVCIHLGIILGQMLLIWTCGVSTLNQVEAQVTQVGLICGWSLQEFKCLLLNL